MVFRKSLTTLAVGALMALAVTIAQAGSCGSPCPSKAQAGCAGQIQMADASCGQGSMDARACAAMCKAQGMSGGGGQSGMSMTDCCGGKVSADCCKNMNMGGACAMHGDMRPTGDEGCKWSCNGIWGDYDCSNPGGRSLLNCRSHEGHHMMFMRGHRGDKGCEMMMGKMGHGERGMKMMRMEGGCCAGGPKMERKVMIMRKHDGAGMPGCMGMQRGAPGSEPPPPPHPAPAPEGAVPPTGQ